jgi:hypothetical protein
VGFRHSFEDETVGIGLKNQEKQKEPDQSDQTLAGALLQSVPIQS